MWRIVAAMLGGVVAVFLFAGCGGSRQTEPASPATRTAIAALLRSKYLGMKVSGGGKIVRLRISVRVAASDPHFARAVFEALGSNGKPVDNAAAVVFMETGGRWSVVEGPGTNFSDNCTRPTATVIRKLLCPDPYSDTFIQ